MRRSNKIKLTQQTSRKNTYLSLAFAIIMITILLYIEAFKTLERAAFIPFALLIIVNLSFFILKPYKGTAKKTIFFKVLFILVSFVMINIYPFTNYSNFKSLLTLDLTQLSTTHLVTEGEIHINRYTIHSGRGSSATYTDIELLNPRGLVQLKIKCDFFATKQTCPELIKFDQQIAKAHYYAENPNFSRENALLLELKTKTATWSFNELIQLYQKQKYASYFYLLMILITNVMIFRAYKRMPKF